MTLADGTETELGARPRGDRRDHELHEHVEPVGDGRRGDPRAQRARAGPENEAVGQDLARAGLEGRDRIPRQGRPDRAAGAARLQPRRLWLHDVHRQLGAAAGGDLEGRRRGGSGGRVGAVGQPQLRGADQPGREDELPGLAAAVRRLRAGGHDGHRHRRRRRSARTSRARTCTCATSGRASARSPRRSSRRSSRTCSARATARCSRATSAGTRLQVPTGDRFAWAEDSTYVRLPPYFQDMPAEPEPVRDIEGARVLAKLGDSVTTDHISPAGSIKRDGPAGKYLQEQGVAPRDFNSYGSRRGNHEVMMRGTFANIRLRNQLAPGTEGGVTRYLGSVRGRAGRRGRGDVDLRRGDEVHRRRRAAGGARRQGVRLGLLARLGGEGHEAARRARGDRRELRAHPPLEPGRDGRAAAAVPRGTERRLAGA